MDPHSDIDPLTALAIRHGTDKWGAHFYTPIYHATFAHLRHKPVRLLEIGVGGYEFRRDGGASLSMWADYFPRGRIVGIDVAEKKLDLGPRVTIVRGSQTDAEFLARVTAEHGPFDIIIDDGSHVPSHVVASFKALFPALAGDGLYVIEDVQTAFWPKYGGSPRTGGDTFALAQSILQALNHAEVRLAAPDWQPPPVASTVRAFRAYHNLFIIEKGDNTEPSSLRLDRDEPHVARAIAAIEREVARAPTPESTAHLAMMYFLTKQPRRALETAQAGLVRWPDNLRLLIAAIRITRRVGAAKALAALAERAVALDPADLLLRKWLERAQAAASSPPAKSTAPTPEPSNVR